MLQGDMSALDAFLDVIAAFNCMSHEDITDGMAECLRQPSLRVQTCIAMSTLSRAGGHEFDSRSRLLQGLFFTFSPRLNAGLDIRPQPTDPWYPNFRNKDQ